MGGPESGGRDVGHPDVPIIRNLDSLRRDMIEACRNVLHAIYEYEQGMPVGGPPEDVEKLIETTERNVRTVLQFLSGQRM